MAAKYSSLGRWITSLLFYQFAGFCLSAATPPARRQATQATATPTTSVSDSITAVSSCHLHGATQYCMAGATEFRISATNAATIGLPSSYTGCHTHGTQTWCMETSGGEVQLLPVVEAETSNPGSATATPTSSIVTAISACHMHGSSIFCMAGTSEYHVQTTVTATSNLPPAFTGCHFHGSDMYCLTPSGDDVEVTSASDDASEDSSVAEEPSGEHCHFHAGVEHCVGGTSSGEESTSSCGRVDRDYNIGLRVGLLFVILATSAIGVFGPIFVVSYVPANNIVFSMLKQFGTGVVISTAFVHLQTHANLMFANECLGELAYEGTAAAVMMAGIFLSFIIEYGSTRLLRWRINKSSTGPETLSAAQNQTVNILVLEAGIIFHSLIIGVTLVVAGDSFFLTLFAVIVFHQMFEGVALGTRIAALGTARSIEPQEGLGHSHGVQSTVNTDTSTATPVGTDEKYLGPKVSLQRKLMLAAPFALVTPIGMAIGIGVIHHFNGNDPSTIVALGTLDAFSAGILVWVGIVEMLAQDWMLGEMTHAKPLASLLGMAALVAGMILMSFLGKWA